MFLLETKKYIFQRNFRLISLKHNIYNISCVTFDLIEKLFGKKCNLNEKRMTIFIFTVIECHNDLEK